MGWRVRARQDSVGQLSVALDVIECIAAAAAGSVLRQQAGVGRAQQAAAVHWLTPHPPPASTTVCNGVTYQSTSPRSAKLVESESRL